MNPEPDTVDRIPSENFYRPPVPEPGPVIRRMGHKFVRTSNTNQRNRSGSASHKADRARLEVVIAVLKRAENAWSAPKENARGLSGHKVVVIPLVQRKVLQVRLALGVREVINVWAKQVEVHSNVTRLHRVA